MTTFYGVKGYDNVMSDEGIHGAVRDFIEANDEWVLDGIRFPIDVEIQAYKPVEIDPLFFDAVLETVEELLDSEFGNPDEEVTRLAGPSKNAWELFCKLVKNDYPTSLYPVGEPIQLKIEQNGGYKVL